MLFTSEHFLYNKVRNKCWHCANFQSMAIHVGKTMAIYSTWILLQAEAISERMEEKQHFKDVEWVNVVAKAKKRKLSPTLSIQPGLYTYHDVFNFQRFTFHEKKPCHDNYPELCWEYMIIQEKCNHLTT